MKKLLIPCLILFIGSTFFASEIDSLWEKRSRVQIEWQDNLANLLLKELPEAKEIILIQRDLQITFIQMAKEKYYYLLQNYPSRIIRNRGQTQWANFDWTKDDEKKLLEISEAYRNLKSTKESLEEKNQGHPMWPKLRESFGAIQKTEEYQEKYKKLIESLEEIDNLLKKIR